MRWWRSSDFVLAAALVAVSVAIYAAQLAIFGDPKNTGFYILQDFAFLPISVLVVTLVLERLSSLGTAASGSRNSRMLIGTFFSWTGYHLLNRLALMDQSLPALRVLIARRARVVRCGLRPGPIGHGRPHLGDPRDARGPRRAQAVPARPGRVHDPAPREPDGPGARVLHRAGLWAVFRLIRHSSSSARRSRACRRAISPTSRPTVTGSTDRLLIESIDHLRYLRKHYPYLYSLAVRMNPSNPGSSPVVGAVG